MLLAVATFGKGSTNVGTPPADPRPPAIGAALVQQTDRVDWGGYAPPADLAGYWAKYCTVAGQTWAQATWLGSPSLLRSQTFVLFADFPAAAVECLVEPVDNAGQEGLPPARAAVGTTTTTTTTTTTGTIPFGTWAKAPNPPGASQVTNVGTAAAIPANPSANAYYVLTGNVSLAATLTLSGSRASVAWFGTY